MSEALFVVGDVREVMAAIPDGSIDLVLTSPPFLALRSYLSADHPDKGKEIGSEATPADFVDTLLDLTVEWRRVLAPHGSLCVELGDTYSGSGGAGGDYAEGGMRESAPGFDGSARRTRTNNLYNTSNRYSDDWNIGNTAGKPIEGVPMTGGRGWPLPKSLCGIPELYRLSLAYGRNMLRPERTIEPWRVRNVIRWCRPNPPVGALGDKFRPATSEMVVACMSRDRWFDLDAVRTEAVADDSRRDEGPQRYEPDGQTARQTFRTSNPAGAPPLDWWQVSTEPYAGSHYATWPRALLTRPIQAMCPREVCTVCGEPRRRIVDAHRAVERTPRDFGGPVNSSYTQMAPHEGWEYERTTLGWSDCDCPVTPSCYNTSGAGGAAESVSQRTAGSPAPSKYRPGWVLDPFAGSGTTLAVATGHGRHALGIDLDSRNLDLARARVGMWLSETTVDELPSLLGRLAVEAG